jgi:membrane-bound ClpP family serine protease
MSLVIWVTLLVLALGVLAIIRQANRNAPQDSTGTVGLLGEAQETFTESGMVLVRGELWRARAPRGIIQKGDAVRVVATAAGLTLLVEKVEEE